MATAKEKPKKDFLSKFINLPLNDDSWSLILKNRSEFLFSDEFDEDSWNAYAKKRGYAPITIVRAEGSHFSATYKDKTVSFQLNNNRDDSFVFILNLAKILESDFKIFYCKDSWHSSDLAFLVIPVQVWSHINIEENKRALKHRLIQLNHCDTDKFLDEAFSSQHKNEYLSNEFSVLIRDAQLPTPAEWVTMFAEYKVQVGWRYWTGELKDPASVPVLDYAGWYLQETHRIEKTEKGLFFSDVRVFSDSFKITFKKTEFNKKAWVVLLKILVRFNKIMLKSGEKVFTQQTWNTLYGDA